MVPRDAKSNNVLNRHPRKKPLNVLANEIFQENEVAPRLVLMHGNKPRQDRGYFDEGVSLRYLHSGRFLERRPSD